MQVTRTRQGQYNVNIHGHDFTLERMFGSKNWSMYNSSGVEVNTTETKSGMLELMTYWTSEYTDKQAAIDSCYYA